MKLLFLTLVLLTACCDAKPDAGAMQPRAVSRCAMVGASYSGESLTVSAVVGDELDGVVMSKTGKGEWGQISGGKRLGIVGATARVGRCADLCADDELPPRGDRCILATLPSANECLRALKSVCGGMR
jgi:hypothetical protein